MITSKRKTIKGLSIAIVAVSSVGVLVCCLLMSIFAIFGASVNNTQYRDDIIKEFQNGIDQNRDNFTFDDDFYYDDNDNDDILGDDDLGEFDDRNEPGIEGLINDIVNGNNTDVVADSLGVFSVIIIIGLCLGLVANIFSIIVGIAGIVACRKPNKLPLAFGLSVAGIVVNILNLSIINLVLMIILLIYVQKERQFVNTYSNGSNVNGEFIDDTVNNDIADTKPEDYVTTSNEDEAYKDIHLDQ